MWVQRISKTLQLPVKSGYCNHARAQIQIQINLQASSTMSSCEPNRTSVYSVDLRWRMLWQREALGLSYQQISGNIGVDKSTGQRTIKLYNSTGSLQKRAYPKDKASRKLTSCAQFFVLNFLCSILSSKNLAYIYMKS